VSHTAWYTAARRAQERWKAATPRLPADARRPGLCMIEERGRRKAVGPFPVCLPQELADFNLLEEIRSEALALFAASGIEWHHYIDGPGGARWPSTHLLDSQVQCVNVLLTLAHHPQRLLAFARRVVPEATRALTVENGLPVAFEWIGLEDHLGESHRGAPQRGRYVTSTDALLVVETPQGRAGILVEWKFTESYAGSVSFIGSGGTDRREVYRGRFQASGSPIDRTAPIDAFFHEPHYQLMRLHLLASAMVERRELGIERAVVAFVSPTENRELAQVPAGLRPFGTTLAEVWQGLVRGPQVSFCALDSNDLLAGSDALAERYASGPLGRLT
jgi:hypothetical protein